MSFYLTFDHNLKVKLRTKAILDICDITKKYWLVIHCWIHLDLEITEQFNSLKSDEN
jgi:hypothetical protein